MPEEEKKKVNVKEDGTPIKPGEEGYLYAGKYKTVEEFEKGYGEADRKITELGQGKAASEKARKLLQDTIVKAGKEKKEEALGEVDKVKKVRVKAMKEAWDKGPEAALDFIDTAIREGISSGGLLKKDDYQKGITNDRELMGAFNKVRGTGDRRKEFDFLKPEMSKLWNALPKEAQTPGMVENIFFMAKGKADPEALKTKMLEEIKAGVGQTPGARSEKDIRTDNEKAMDGIVEQKEKDKAF